MHSEIDIQVNGQSMALPPDFSLDVTEENPLFHDVEMHSDPVQAPMEGNRHIFSNVDDPQSHQRPVDLEHTPAKWSVSGIPFRSGTIAIQEDDELDGAFSFNIDEARQSFKDLIGDLKCQDVPLYNNELIPIGEKVCDVNVELSVEVDVRCKMSDFIGYVKGDFLNNRPWTVSGQFDPQALGFSFPGKANVSSSNNKPRTYPEGISVNHPAKTKDYINVSEPYESNGGVPAAGKFRYCNARVCYTHHGLNTDKASGETTAEGGQKITGTIGETTDDIMKVDDNYGTYENYGPYWVLDADRQQSGICFYVLYFLDCLFNHLGVVFDNSALTAIEDLRRLCFFTTKCKFMTDTANPVQTLSGIDAINKWLDDCGCGGRIEFPDSDEKDFDEAGDSIDIFDLDTQQSYHIVVGQLVHGVGKVASFKTNATVQSVTSATAKVCTMYATNENFPDEAVSTVISSLENSFGIRFHYDYQHNKVTAYLLRDVFRQKDGSGNALAPITLPCEVLKVNKLSEKITGVRMKYSAESDGKEQMENIRRAKRDYDTDFDYIDYRQDRTKVSADGYKSIASDLKTENVTCYVDLNTADAYRFKISKDVDSGDVAYHRLFEVGQFKGIEVGDCSPANEDFIKEFVSDFQPMSWNDVNAYAELKKGSTEPILAAYIDEDMEHEFVSQKINHPVYTDKVDIYATEVLRLVESYDPTGTEDGNSPLQDMDWGLAVAIMRGGGTDATVQNFDRNYDNFDNSKWRQVAGGYAMTSDSMDQYGTQYDYNGTQEGIGDGERFSLKIRSWKPFLYYNDSSGKTHVTSDLSLEGKPVEGVSGKTWLKPCNADEKDTSGKIIKRIATRGLADVFMAEVIHFFLKRRKLRIHLLAEAAALVDIPNHWRRRFRIGDNVGYIDKINYSISAESGIGEVTIDLFEI